jgi:hypothetical protein
MNMSYATTAVAPTEIADPALGGPVEWISVLSTTGVTAYVGMHDVGNVQPALRRPCLSAANGWLDVVVGTDRGQQAVRAAFVDAESRLGCR